MLADVPLARRDVIASRLAEGRPVSSGSLAREFDVSEDAVRRDLRALASLGLCRRVYGGALPLQPGSSTMAERMGERLDQKRALAEAAAATVEPGEFLFLDNGSTNLAVAGLLPEAHDLTVATNSVEIAAAVLRRQDIPLLLIGGVVDPVVGGSVDAAAIEAVSRLNIDRCFLSVCALDAVSGASALEPADAAFKRTLLSRSGRSLVLATNEKLGGRAPHRVAQIPDIDRIIVGHDAPEEAVATLVEAGARITRAAAT